MKTLTSYVLAVSCTFAMNAEAHLLGFTPSYGLCLFSFFSSGGLYLLFKAAL